MKKPPAVSNEFKKNFNFVMAHINATTDEANYERERCLKNIVAAEICYANLAESIRLERLGIDLRQQLELLKKANIEYENSDKPSR
jgi:hypothetical protein